MQHIGIVSTRNPFLKHRGRRTFLAPSNLLGYSLVVSAAPKAYPDQNRTKTFHACLYTVPIAPSGKATG